MAIKLCSHSYACAVSGWRKTCYMSGAQCRRWRQQIEFRKHIIINVSENGEYYFPIRIAPLNNSQHLKSVSVRCLFCTDVSLRSAIFTTVIQRHLVAELCNITHESFKWRCFLGKNKRNFQYALIINPHDTFNVDSSFQKNKTPWAFTRNTSDRYLVRVTSRRVPSSWPRSTIFFPLELASRAAKSFTDHVFVINYFGVLFVCWIWSPL